MRRRARWKRGILAELANVANRESHAIDAVVQYAPYPARAE
jgi:hypothetical protein